MICANPSVQLVSWLAPHLHISSCKLVDFWDIINEDAQVADCMQGGLWDVRETFLFPGVLAYEANAQVGAQLTDAS